jgi:hypothetical protein
MTATVVNGMRVVSDEVTPSPYLRDRAGNPVVWHRTRTLRLEDGSVVYGCAECDYVSENPNSVRPHLGAHTDRPRRGKSRRNGQADPSTLSLAELLSRVDSLRRVEADRDAWRVRAQTAERSLATLRKALRP